MSGKPYALLALIVAVLAIAAPLATMAEAQAVVYIKSSRDAWGTVWKNTTFYVDVRLTSKPGTNINLSVEVTGYDPAQVSAVYVPDTFYVYRVWFLVDSNGTLKYATASSATMPTSWTTLTVGGKPVVLSQGAKITISYEDKTLTLTYTHSPAELNIRTSVPFPVDKTGTYDWVIVAPDLNRDPASEDRFAAVVQIEDLTKLQKWDIVVPYTESGGNTAEFKPSPITFQVSNSTTITSASAGAPHIVRISSTNTTGYYYNKTHQLAYRSNVELTVNSITVHTGANTTVNLTIDVTVSAGLYDGTAFTAMNTYSAVVTTNVTLYHNATTGLYEGSLSLTLDFARNTSVNIYADLTYDEARDELVITSRYVYSFTYEYIYAMINAGTVIEAGDYVVATFAIPQYHGATDIDEARTRLTIFRVAGTIVEAKATLTTLYVKVDDPSENKRSYGQDTLSVTVVFPNNQNVTIPLEETDVNTGVFEGTLDILKYYRAGPISAVTGPAFNGTKNVLLIIYEDPSEGTKRTKYVTIQFHKANITLEPAIVAVTSTLKIIVQDEDLNILADEEDIYDMLLNAGDPFKFVVIDRRVTGEPLASLLIYAVYEDDTKALAKLTSTTRVVMVETGVDTGVFELVVDLSKLNLTTVPGKKLKQILVVYYDYLTPEGNVSVKAAVDIAKVSITADRTEIPLSNITDTGYLKVHVQVVDPSANTDMYHENSVTVYWSLHTADGTVVHSNTTTLVETDINTGVFGKPPADVIEIPLRLFTPSLIGGYLKITYISSQTGEKAELTIPLVVYGAELSVDKTTARYGDEITITVEDPDANLDAAEVENITVAVYAGASLIATIPLTETEPDSGVFTGTAIIAGASGAGDIVVRPGTAITIVYVDKTSPITPQGAEEWEEETLSQTIYIRSHTGVLMVNNETDTVEVGPASTVIITVEDWDLNVDPQNPDTATVFIRLPDVGPEEVQLTETGASTGVFTVELDVNTIASILGHNWTELIGQPIYITYRDSVTAEGNIATITVELRIRTWDAIIETDKTAYNPGEKIKIKVIDPDQAGANMLPVRVFSTSDAIGMQVTLIETEPGVFEGEVLVTDTPTIAAGYIYARVGDTVTIQYTDNYPADYAVTRQPKTFTVTVAIGIRPEPPSEIVGHRLVDPATGQTLETVEVGKMATIEVSIENRDILDHTMTILLIVKDAEGVTVYVAYAVQTVPAGRSVSVGFGWIPEEPGTYTVEVHVIRSLAEPISLAKIASFTIVAE